MRTVDAHLHLWSLATPGHRWPDATIPALHRDFLAADLHEATHSTGLRAAVLVQSQPTDADTDWMLAVAAREPLIAGVVGWVDLASPDAPARIAALARHDKLKAVRPMLQSIADTDWLLDEALTPAIEALVAHRLRLDALVQPRHLKMLARFSRRWPDLPVVIDHGAKPVIGDDPPAIWKDEIADLAAQGLACKLSGLRTEQATGRPAAQLLPYVEHLSACFGSSLMWGSDWPVSTLVDDYAGSLDHARRLAAAVGADEQTLFTASATAFYGLAVEA